MMREISMVLTKTKGSLPGLGKISMPCFVCLVSCALRVFFFCMFVFVFVFAFVGLCLILCLFRFLPQY
jgi:hypothetical protein